MPRLYPRRVKRQRFCFSRKGGTGVEMRFFVLEEPMEDKIATFEAGLDARIERVFAAHRELLGDHRARHPWVTGYLGNPFAPVWFIAENPSLGQMIKIPSTSSREHQWNISKGDKLFRKMLVEHGFKSGAADQPGGWNCYITDVIKSAAAAGKWDKLPAKIRYAVAEAWAPVLRWELEAGTPRVVVAVGRDAERYLTRLERDGAIPPLPALRYVEHYTSVAMRPRGRVPPNDPARIEEYRQAFAEFATAARARSQSS
jgi:hypothetical protein